MSDCGAVSNIVNAERRVPSMAAAAAHAINAGTDLNCGDGYDAMATAVDQKLVAVGTIDQARCWRCAGYGYCSLSVCDILPIAAIALLMVVGGVRISFYYVRYSCYIITQEWWFYLQVRIFFHLFRRQYLFIAIVFNGWGVFKFW